MSDQINSITHAISIQLAGGVEHEAAICPLLASKAASLEICRQNKHSTHGNVIVYEASLMAYTISITSFIHSFAFQGGFSS